MTLKIGLSLSRCVLDILEKKVDIKDVAALITGTKAETEPQWIELLDGYHQLHWRKFTWPQIWPIIHELRMPHERIIQPRIYGQEPPPQSGGYWIVIGPNQSRDEAAENKLKAAKLAFMEIARGEGAFSRDRLEHATNCIENMQALANEALSEID